MSAQVLAVKTGCTRTPVLPCGVGIFDHLMLDLPRQEFDRRGFGGDWPHPILQAAGAAGGCRSTVRMGGTMRKMILAASVLLLAGSGALAIEGEPIPNRDVKLGKKPPGKGIVIAHSVTDANGVVSFKNLKDGTYFIRFADADRTFEVASNGSGKPIRVHKLGKSAANTEAEEPSDARAGERFTISFGTVAARVEVVNDTLKVTLFRPRTPSDS